MIRHIVYDAYQPIVCNHIHVFLNAVFAAFVDGKDFKPVAGTLADDSGPDRTVFFIFCFELQKILKTVKLYLILRQNPVLHLQGIDLLLKDFVIFFQLFFGFYIFIPGKNTVPDGINPFLHRT